MTFQKGKWIPFALFSAAVLWHLATMPGSYYEGDNFAPRTEAVFLVTTGTIGMPYVPDLKRDGFLLNRGQYFFENDARQEMFSKYGLLNTFLYVPPLLVERNLRGVLPPLATSITLLAFINSFNALFFAAALIYLYGLAALYTRKMWVRVAWVFVTCFSTFVWFYLRAPALEVYQIPAVLAAAFHAVVFWRIRRARRGGAPRGAWLNLACAATACAVAANLKSLFVLLIPAVVVFALLAGDGRLTAAARVRANLGMYWRQFSVAVFLPMAIGLGLLLWSNWYRFGSAFETGYAQWMTAEGIRNDRFGLEFVLPAIKGFLLVPGNPNLWMHAPLLFAAVPAWRTLFRRRRSEGLFVVAVVLSLLTCTCSFSAWGSGWCFGPRYLVHLVPLVMIPLVFVLEGVRAMRRPARVAAVALLVLVTGVSVALNLAVNSLPYFAAIQATGQFAPSKDAAIRSYLRTHPHSGQVSADLLLHHVKAQEFPPLRIARQRYGASFPDDIAALEKFIAREAAPDWWTLKWVRARRAGQTGFPTLPPADRTRRKTERPGLPSAGVTNDTH